MGKCFGISLPICAFLKKPPRDTRSLWGGTPGFLLATRNIVLSRTHPELIPGIEIVRTLSDALLLLDKEEKAFVIGGAYTYREALPRISEAYITEIDQDFDGDTFFTMTDPAAWNIEEVGTFEDGGCTGRFTHWVRK